MCDGRNIMLLSLDMGMPAPALGLENLGQKLAGTGIPWPANPGKQFPCEADRFRAGQLAE
eukprot:gene12045-14730_t